MLNESKATTITKVGDSAPPNNLPEPSLSLEEKLPKNPSTFEPKNSLVLTSYPTRSEFDLEPGNWEIAHRGGRLPSQNRENKRGNPSSSPEKMSSRSQTSFTDRRRGGRLGRPVLPPRRQNFLKNPEDWLLGRDLQAESEITTRNFLKNLSSPLGLSTSSETLPGTTHLPETPVPVRDATEVAQPGLPGGVSEDENELLFPDPSVTILDGNICFHEKNPIGATTVVFSQGKFFRFSADVLARQPKPLSPVRFSTNYTPHHRPVRIG